VEHILYIGMSGEAILGI